VERRDIVPRNPETGEITLGINGTTYTLLLDTNAMVLLEEWFASTTDAQTSATLNVDRLAQALNEILNVQNAQSEVATLERQLSATDRPDERARLVERLEHARPSASPDRVWQIARQALSQRSMEGTFQDVLLRVSKGSVRYIRALIWAALRRNHPTITIEQAGDLIQAAGGLFALSEQLVALADTASPDPVDVKDLGVSAERPPKAHARRRGNGAGATSISPPVAPA
jgi:hypothetical protein